MHRRRRSRTSTILPLVFAALITGCGEAGTPDAEDGDETRGAPTELARGLRSGLEAAGLVGPR